MGAGQKKLIGMLKWGEIHGIVKIDVGGISLRNYYRDTFSCSYVNRGSILSFSAKVPNKEKHVKRTVMIFPVSPEEGANCEKRKQGIKEAIKELRIFFHYPLHIGFLALCRHKTSKNEGYDNDAIESYKEAERLTKEIEDPSNNISTKNYALDLEHALNECDIISPYRGGYGGLFYRTLCFVGNAKEVASPSFVSHPYVGGTNHLGNLVMRVRYAVAKYGAVGSTNIKNLSIKIYIIFTCFNDYV